MPPPGCLQYAAVSVTGYAALGNDVPGSIVLGFVNAPAWVTILANLMVLVHMVRSQRIKSLCKDVCTKGLSRNALALHSPYWHCVYAVSTARGRFLHLHLMFHPILCHPSAPGAGLSGVFPGVTFSMLGNTFVHTGPPDCALLRPLTQLGLHTTYGKPTLPLPLCQLCQMIACSLCLQPLRTFCCKTFQRWTVSLAASGFCA